MQIGAVSFRPYIYNTNMLSGNSLSKVSSIGEDLLTGKTDFSALTDESLNENPLGKGQSANFVDILEMQMQTGRMNASRIMKQDETQSAQMADEVKAQASQSLTDTEEAAGALWETNDTANIGSVTEDFQPAGNVEEIQGMQTDRNLYMMQRAADAYMANMIA